MGLSTALAHARDLADWLSIKNFGLYNFKPAVRPVPMTIHVQGFPGKHYCPRMALMNKPEFEKKLVVQNYLKNYRVLQFINRVLKKNAIVAISLSRFFQNCLLLN